MRILITGASGFIGTNFLNRVQSEGCLSEVLNLDVVGPKLPEHRRFWKYCDVLDREQLQLLTQDFAPTHLVHMAARTDMDGKTVEDYAVNTMGIENLLAALECATSMARAVFVSSQYVIGPGPLANDDCECRPHTIYGMSKCIMENRIREAALPFSWVIVRPTNIWGPWHPRYAKEFWFTLRRGWYLHPGGAPVLRAYGYVGNIVEQMWQLLTISSEAVNRQTYYVGDPVDDVREWVTAFSVAIHGSKPRVVSRRVLRMIAFLGDVIRMAGGSFPLFTSRYQSMTTDYLVDMSKTYALLGPPKYSLKEGVAITVEWLNQQW
jgi:GlcNAc-P-P-Und epimerase